MGSIENEPDTDEFDDMQFYRGYASGSDGSDNDYSKNRLYEFHNHEVVEEEERDKLWDVKLCDAIRGEAVNAVAGVERALDNRANVNAFSEGASNLAWAFTFNPMEPEREEVIRLLVRHGAEFIDEREELEIYNGYASNLSPGLFQDLVYSDRFNSVNSWDVLAAMRWLIIQQKPNALGIMREYIHQVKVIFHELKEKNKTDNGGNDSGDDSGDENDEYIDLDDFLSKIIHGNSLLHLAVESGLHEETCIPMLRELINNGARLNVKDKDGHTPREIAEKLLMSRHRTRHDLRVLDILEREEALQEAEFREIERQKFESIAMTKKERMGKNSLFENVDPEVIDIILEQVRKLMNVSKS